MNTKKIITMVGVMGMFPQSSDALSAQSVKNAVSRFFNKESVSNFTKYVVTSTVSSCLSNGLANAYLPHAHFLKQMIVENIADAAIQPCLELYYENSHYVNSAVYGASSFVIAKLWNPATYMATIALEAGKHTANFIDNNAHIVYKYAEPLLRESVGYHAFGSLAIPMAATALGINIPLGVSETMAYTGAYLARPVTTLVTKEYIPLMAQKASSVLKKTFQCASDLKKKLEKTSWISGGEINNPMHENSVGVSDQQKELNVLVHQEKPANTEEKATRQSASQASQEANQNIRKLSRESGREK